ncbi:MAG: hypothetical protein QM305_08715 [Bacteroidota bacterium]|nr:hypothetical protein [Bacteroidota bacterium]
MNKTAKRIHFDKTGNKRKDMRQMYHDMANRMMVNKDTDAMQAS